MLMQQVDFRSALNFKDFFYTSSLFDRLKKTNLGQKFCHLYLVSLSVVPYATNKR